MIEVLSLITGAWMAVAGFFGGGAAVGAPTVSYEKDLLPIADSTYSVGTTSNAFADGVFDRLCLTADTCRTSWPAAGGGGGSGNVSTSTNESAGNLAYWTSTSGSPASLGEVATTSVSCSGATTCTSFVAIGPSPITISSTATGSGLATTSPVADSNVLTYSAAGAGSAYGTATTSVSSGTGISFGGTAGALIGGTNLTITNSSPLSGLTTAFPFSFSDPTLSWIGLATSSDIASDDIIYATGANTIAGAATSSLTASSPLSLSQPISVIGSAASALSLDTSGTWSGNANTATALAANGANCTAGNSPLGVDALGAVESCFDVWTEAENTSAAYISLTDLSATWPIDYNSGTGAFTWGGLATTSQPTAGQLLYSDGLNGLIPVSTSSINVGTATALAANGANCSAGSYALGVDASGAAEGCTDATTEIDSAISTHASNATAHQALVTLAGSLDYLTLTGQEITRNAIDLTTDVTGTLPVGNGGTGVTALSSLNLTDFTNDLSALTAGTGLSAAGTYNGSTARTFSLDTANANTWTALQTFANASSTNLDVWNQAAFGATATSSFDSAGVLTLIGNLVFDGTTLTGTTGVDTQLVSGTLSTTNAVVTVNADDDLVEEGTLTWNVTPATCTGDGNGGALTVNGSNQIVCSADDGGAGGSGDPFAWTPATHWGQTVSGTTTALWLQGSPFSLFASSTARFDYASTTQLSIADAYIRQTAAGGGTTRFIGAAALDITDSSQNSDLYLSDGTFQLSNYNDGTFDFLNSGSNVITLDFEGATNGKILTVPDLTGAFALGQSYTTGFTNGDVPFGSSGLLATSSALSFNNTDGRLTVTYASTTAISGSNATFTTLVGALTGNVTGNADTATALVANGGNCTSGNAPLGVDALGAVENCFDVWTEAENTAAAYISLTDLSATWPIDYNSGTGAFTWGGIATSSALSISQLLYATGVNTFESVATSSVTCSSASGISCTGFDRVGAGGDTLSLSAIPNSSLTNSTISGISLGSNLADLTATDSTLTFSGTYNGGTARTIGLNLANANAWTALQEFTNASSSLLSVYGPAYFGGTATSTFDTAGNLTLVGNFTFDGTTHTGTSGVDTTLLSGTVATTNAVLTVNADDDIVEETNGLTWNITPATCTGDGNGGALTISGTEIVCSADDGGGASVSFGADNQIPFTNVTTDDFDYSANFTFDGSAFNVLGTATTSLFSSNQAWFGGTATTSIDAAGNLTVGSGGTWDTGGIDIPTGDTFAINSVDVLTNDTLGSSVVTSSLTTVGALNSGSITSGFGNIDVGASTIDTTGAVSFGNTTVNTGATLTVTDLTSAILLTGAGGTLAEYTGTSCTNQFVRSLSALGVATCETVANTDLANSTVSYGGIQLSLGGSDATPAFNLSDATAYPGDSSLVTTGALNSGSITSGFGNIDIGSSNFDADGIITSLGTLDFGGATSLEIPNNGTVNANGEITTDDTSGQLRFFAGSAERVISPVQRLGFAYATTSWTGTTTLNIGPAYLASSVDYLYCETNTGTVAVSLYDGTNRADFVPTASTTINKFNYSTNNTFTAGESMRVDLGQPASSPTRISCSFGYTVTAD